MPSTRAAREREDRRSQPGLGSGRAAVDWRRIRRGPAAPTNRPPSRGARGARQGATRRPSYILLKDDLEPDQIIAAIDWEFFAQNIFVRQPGATTTVSAA